MWIVGMKTLRSRFHDNRYSVALGYRPVLYIKQPFTVLENSPICCLSLAEYKSSFNRLTQVIVEKLEAISLLISEMYCHHLDIFRGPEESILEWEREPM